MALDFALRFFRGGVLTSWEWNGCSPHTVVKSSPLEQPKEKQDKIDKKQKTELC